MGENSYCDELERTLARSDAEALQDTINVYSQFAALDGKSAQLFYDENHGAIDAVMLSADDPNKAFAYLALSTSMFDEPAFLMLMAAGPLENLMCTPRPGVLDRIIAEAKRTLASAGCLPVCICTPYLMMRAWRLHLLLSV